MIFVRVLLGAAAQRLLKAGVRGVSPSIGYSANAAAGYDLFAEGPADDADKRHPRGNRWRLLGDPELI